MRSDGPRNINVKCLWVRVSPSQFSNCVLCSSAHATVTICCYKPNSTTDMAMHKVRNDSSLYFVKYSPYQICFRNSTRCPFHVTALHFNCEPKFHLSFMQTAVCSSRYGTKVNYPDRSSAPNFTESQWSVAYGRMHSVQHQPTQTGSPATNCTRLPSWPLALLSRPSAKKCYNEFYVGEQKVASKPLPTSMPY